MVKTLIEKQKSVTTAESCTGGWIAKLLTDIPGSSAVFPGACVSYTNDVKKNILGVDEKIIDTYTEVSGECAKAMAVGAKKLFSADFALSATGFAGPGGGNEKDPVGTVYLGFTDGKKTIFERFSAPDDADREEVRILSAIRSLEILSENL